MEISSWFQDVSWLGFVALLTGIIYVYLAALNLRSCWVFGIISCSIIAFEDITRYNLYSDAVLQTFYVFTGFWGLYSWRDKGTAKKAAIPVRIQGKHHFLIVLSSVILALGAGAIIKQHTTAAVPTLDAFTTILSIFATFMLVFRKRENWLYWIGIDIMYIYIYSRQGADFYALLSVVYLIMAIKGWVNWGKSEALANK